MSLQMFCAQAFAYVPSRVLGAVDTRVDLLCQLAEADAEDIAA